MRLSELDYDLPESDRSSDSLCFHMIVVPYKVLPLFLGCRSIEPQVSTDHIRFNTPAQLSRSRRLVRAPTARSRMRDCQLRGRADGVRSAVRLLRAAVC